MSLARATLSLAALGLLHVATGSGLVAYGQERDAVETKSTRHVVTVSGGEWLYQNQDQRSGIGVANPVVVRAAAGDTIVFRQADGHHGIFFYVTSPYADESELGKKIIVDRDFAVLENAPGRPFEPLSNRLFSRRALGTATEYGNKPIMTIVVAEDFHRRIYFGCPVHSTSGRNREFGEIIPTVPEPRQVTALSEISEVESSTPTPLLGALERRLGTLTRGNTWSWELRTNPYRLVVQHIGAEEIDQSDQWFKDVPIVDPRKAPWYHVTTADLDGDGDNDLVAAVASPTGDGWQWWALESSVANRVPADPDTFRFIRATPLGDSALPLAWIDTAHGAVADVNRDQRPDLILYDGDPQGKLRMYYNSGPVSRDEAFSFRESAQPIDISRDFSSQIPYFIYAHDFDIDGYVDLLMGSEGQDAVLYYNDATGRFPYVYAKPVPESSSRIVDVGMADGDGDGLLDLILTDPEGERSIRYNHGDRRLISMDPEVGSSGNQNEPSVEPMLPRVVTREIPHAVVNERYDVQMSGFGVGELTWEFGGTLPRGLNFTSDGISGTALTTGTTTISVTVSDAVGTSASAKIQLSVVDPAETVRLRTRDLEADVASLEAELVDARRAAADGASTNRDLRSALEQARSELEEERQRPHRDTDPPSGSLFNWLTVTFMGLSIALVTAGIWHFMRALSKEHSS